MSTTDTAAAALRDLPPLLRVACPTCRVPMGSACATTTTARPVLSGHTPRWERLRRETANRPSRWLLIRDDARFDLAVGDVLVGRPYWLDPDKVTVEYREADRYDPQCNQYRADVRWIGWAE